MDISSIKPEKVTVQSRKESPANRKKSHQGRKIGGFFDGISSVKQIFATETEEVPGKKSEEVAKPKIETK